MTIMIIMDAIDAVDAPEKTLQELRYATMLTQQSNTPPQLKPQAKLDLYSTEFLYLLRSSQ